jgi:hypothetical protein
MNSSRATSQGALFMNFEPLKPDENQIRSIRPG